MIELFTTAWDFVRRPSFALDEYIRKWPTQLGLWLLVFYYLSAFFGSTQSMSVSFDIFVAISDNAAQIGMVGFYAFQLLLGSISIFLIWFVYPQVVRKFYRYEPTRFDENLCRRLFCYAAFPQAVMAVFVNLPFALLSKPLAELFIRNAKEASTGLVLIGVMLAIPLLLASVVLLFTLLVMYFVIQWKGLTTFFELSSMEKVLVIFVIPLIAGLPNLFFTYPQIIKFLQNYPGFHK